MSCCFTCRPSVQGCLKGIAGLLGNSADALKPSLVVSVLMPLLDVDIAALPQSDRMLALSILLQALQVCLKLHMDTCTVA